MSTEQEGSYQVGYKKPPPQHRFANGRSGNPDGRPKKAKTIHTLLDQALKETVVVTENGRRKTISKFEAFVKQLVNKATGGDARSGKFLIELLREAKPELAKPLVIYQMAGEDRL
jgi:Family of unknown function (DUF5681)